MISLTRAQNRCPAQFALLISPAHDGHETDVQRGYNGLAESMALLVMYQSPLYHTSYFSASPANTSTHEVDKLCCALILMSPMPFDSLTSVLI